MRWPPAGRRRCPRRSWPGRRGSGRPCPCGAGAEPGPEPASTALTRGRLSEASTWSGMLTPADPGAGAGSPFTLERHGATDAGGHGLVGEGPPAESLATSTSMDNSFDLPLSREPRSFQITSVLVIGVGLRARARDRVLDAVGHRDGVDQLDLAERAVVGVGDLQGPLERLARAARSRGWLLGEADAAGDATLGDGHGRLQVADAEVGARARRSSSVTRTTSTAPEAAVAVSSGLLETLPPMARGSSPMAIWATLGHLEIEALVAEEVLERDRGFMISPPASRTWRIGRLGLDGAGAVEDRPLLAVGRGPQDPLAEELGW